ncbi:unnamed protein product [Urochloa humidicola]
MAGEKGRGKRSAAQAEHRGGDERGPKIRKVTQEEMGKRKGKLQIKGRDKPMEVDKMRRLEEKGKEAVREERGKEAVPEEGAAADFVRRMTEEKVAFYKKIVERDSYPAYTEEQAQYYPMGPDEARKMNAIILKFAMEFKEHAAMKLKEYETLGYLESFPPVLPPNFLNPLIGDK